MFCYYTYMQKSPLTDLDDSERSIVTGYAPDTAGVTTSDKLSDVVNWYFKNTRGI